MGHNSETELLLPTNQLTEPQHKQFRASLLGGVENDFAAALVLYYYSQTTVAEQVKRKEGDNPDNSKTKSVFFSLSLRNRQEEESIRLKSN